MKNKNGQVLSIVAFFVITLSVFILAMLLMSLVNTILHPVATELGKQSALAGSSVTDINNKFNQWWDFTIIVLFIFNVVILFISSYMVDTHPIFLIVYIIAAFILIIFGGNILSALEPFWSSTGYNGSGNVTDGGNIIQYMPITTYMLDHFTYIILGIIVLSGIVMYAKFKYGTGGNF